MCSCVGLLALSRWLKIIPNCVTFPTPIIMILLVLRLLPMLMRNLVKLIPLLLNLVMKDQFSSLPNEDVASHLNNFVDLCDMQKKKDVE